MSDNGQIPVIVVAGPTCSGKSAAALDLAERFDGTVINADSMQIYRELRVLTARPSAEDEARAPHRLYGVISAVDACSAARWRKMAVEAVRRAHDNGRLPILCGGTGLYIKALMEGFSPIPEIPVAVRETVRRHYGDAEAPEIHDALQRLDAEMASRIPPTDRQRLLRAVEVLEATGRSLAEWQAVPPSGPPTNFAFHTIVLTPGRQALYAACDARFRTMIDAGGIAEVRRLRAMRLDPTLPAMKAVGVTALIDFLEGRADLESAVAAAQQATRNYAKRQMTWFSRQIIADISLQTQYSEKLRSEIFSFICKNMLTRP